MCKIFSPRLVVISSLCVFGSMTLNAVDTQPVPTQKKYASVDEEIADIDIQIKKLQREKKEALTRARFLSREADRVITQDWIGYRRYIIQEDRFREEAKEADAKIKVLEARKAKLLNS